MEPLTVRCSSLPRVLACPASALPEAEPTGSDDEAGRIGSAVHLVLSSGIADPKGPGIHPRDAAARYGADPDEVSRLAWWGWRLWEKLAPRFPDPVTEQPYTAEVSPGLILTGHIDVLSVVETTAGKELRILDWKSGWSDEDFSDQLKGYAFLGLENHPACSRAWVATVRLRDNMQNADAFSREELSHWAAGLAERLAHPEYRPGPAQCKYCPRGLTCQAKHALVRQAALVILNNAQLDPSEYGALYDKVRLVEKACEQARDAIKLRVQAAGGIMHLKDGRALQIVEQERKKIEPRVALPILHDEIGEEATTDCMSFSKTDVEKAVKASRPTGKGAAVKELFDRLEAAGGFTTTKSQRLEIKQHGPGIENTPAK